MINKAQSFFKKNVWENTLTQDPDLKTLTGWYCDEILYVSKQIDALEKTNNLTSSCRKGCTHCCKQAIFISPSEIDILKHTILKLDSSIREDIKRRAKSICTAITGTQIPRKFSSTMPIEKQQAINEEYFEKNLICPLVGENNECLIYDIRPLVCLTYRSYGDREECAFTYTPKMGHAYITCDANIRSTLDDCYTPESADYQLLASALSDITSAV